MKRIYVAGPMTGLPDFNYPAFHAAAEALRYRGYEVENPAENPDPPGKTWLGYMRLAIPQMLTCDTVLLLPGWSKSRGARIEAVIAGLFDLSIITDDPHALPVVPGTLLFNPYTGKTRDPRDISSDPKGKLIVDKNAPLTAASAPSTSWTCPSCCTVFPEFPKSCPHQATGCDALLAQGN